MRGLYFGVGALACLLMAPNVMAGMVDTPNCRADLAQANELTHAIRLRERRMSRDDLPGACILLRQNVADMTQAGKLMEPCLTGHEKGENLGQIHASIGDMRQILARNCR